jgi:hypothetical protein
MAAAWLRRLKPANYGAEKSPDSPICPKPETDLGFLLFGYISSSPHSPIGAIGALMNIVLQPRTLLVRGRNAEMGTALHGYLADKKHPPPWDHHRSLGIGLL